MLQVLLLLFAGDSFFALEKQLARMNDMGFDNFYAGPELEFFLFGSREIPTILDKGGYFGVADDAAVDVRRGIILALVDMGIDVRGYKSDLTRIFFLGKISPIIREINDFVRDAQKEAIKKIRPGIQVLEIDKQARNYLAKNKLAKFFNHSLGHGIGLEVHECPHLSQKSSSVLKENMIVTVEPGVYIPGKFGIRIEDMVLVTKENCEINGNQTTFIKSSS